MAEKTQIIAIISPLYTIGFPSHSKISEKPVLGQIWPIFRCFPQFSQIRAHRKWNSITPDCAEFYSLSEYINFDRHPRIFRHPLGEQRDIFAFSQAPLIENFFSCWEKKIYSPSFSIPVILRPSACRCDVAMYCNSPNRSHFMTLENSFVLDVSFCSLRAAFVVDWPASGWGLVGACASSRTPFSLS